MYRYFHLQIQTFSDHAMLLALSLCYSVFIRVWASAPLSQSAIKFLSGSYQNYLRHVSDCPQAHFQLLVCSFQAFLSFCLGIMFPPSRIPLRPLNRYQVSFNSAQVPLRLLTFFSQSAPDPCQYLLSFVFKSSENPFQLLAVFSQALLKITGTSQVLLNLCSDCSQTCLSFFSGCFQISVSFYGLKHLPISSQASSLSIVQTPLWFFWNFSQLPFIRLSVYSWTPLDFFRCLLVLFMLLSVFLKLFSVSFRLILLSSSLKDSSLAPPQFSLRPHSRSHHLTPMFFLVSIQTALRLLFCSIHSSLTFPSASADNPLVSCEKTSCSSHTFLRRSSSDLFSYSSPWLLSEHTD